MSTANSSATLYHHPMHSNSRYARILIGEYGQSATLVEEKFWRRSEALLALNPGGYVPVLTLDGQAPLAGGSVIGEFLDETHGAFQREKRLMPENTAERAEVRRLTDWALNKMDQEVMQYIAGERIYKLIMTNEEGGGSPDTAIIRVGRTNLRGHLGYLSHLVVIRNWVAGKRISLADIAFAANISILDYLGEIAWEKEPALKDWYVRIKCRPSFRELLKDKIVGLAPASHYGDLDF